RQQDTGYRRQSDAPCAQTRLPSGKGSESERVAVRGSAQARLRYQLSNVNYQLSCPSPARSALRPPARGKVEDMRATRALLQTTVESLQMRAPRAQLSPVACRLSTNYVRRTAKSARRRRRGRGSSRSCL